MSLIHLITQAQPSTSAELCIRHLGTSASTSRQFGTVAELSYVSWVRSWIWRTYLFCHPVSSSGNQHASLQCRQPALKHPCCCKLGCRQPSVLMLECRQPLLTVRIA